MNAPAQLIICTPVGDHLQAFYHRVAAHVDAPIRDGDPAAVPRQTMRPVSAPSAARCLRECCVLC